MDNETNSPVCSCCGATIETDDYYTFEGSILCDDCYHSETVVCEHCGDRIWSDDNAGSDNMPLCNSCYDDYYTTCECCGRIIHRDYANYDDDDCAYCDHCYEERQNSSIHEYNYKPEPIFYGDSKRYFGVELEIDEGGKNGDNADTLLGIGNRVAEHIYIKLSEYNNLFSAIYNLLLFGYIRLGMCSLDYVNFQSDSYILQNKLQEYLESYTEKYAENSSFARWLSNTKTIVKSKEIINLIDVLIFFLERTNIYGEFIIDLQELYIIPKITIESYTTTININDGNKDNLLSVLIDSGSKLCFQIVEDFVNFSRIRIDFNEETKKYYVKLEANNLFIASIVELYYLITSGREIRKCAAKYCGVFFFPTRPNKYYCCQDCKRKSEMKRRRDRKANESSNKCDSSTTTPSHHDTAENN
mgnify:CR=1 FL=1